MLHAASLQADGQQYVCVDFLFDRFDGLTSVCVCVCVIPIPEVEVPYLLVHKTHLVLSRALFEKLPFHNECIRSKTFSMKSASFTFWIVIL